MALQLYTTEVNTSWVGTVDPYAELTPYHAIHNSLYSRMMPISNSFFYSLVTCSYVLRNSHTGRGSGSRVASRARSRSPSQGTASGSGGDESRPQSSQVLVELYKLLGVCCCENATSLRILIRTA